MKPNGMHFPFGPFLWQTTLDIDVVDDLLDKTKNTIKYHNDKLAGIIDEEHKFSDEDTSWFANKTSSVIKEYLNLDWHYYDQGTDTLKNLKSIHLASLWFNNMKPGESNPPHSHDGDISFVLYLQVPNEIIEENNNFKGRSSGPGKIDFFYGEYQKAFHSTYSFLPIKGEMFIFPSNLRHSVNPYRSNVNRISVSGNYNLVF